MTDHGKVVSRKCNEKKSLAQLFILYDEKQMSQSFKVDLNAYRSSTTVVYGFAYFFTVVCTTSGGRNLCISVARWNTWKAPKDGLICM